MLTTTSAELPVIAYVPAGPARMAADLLYGCARDAHADGRVADADRVSLAAAALHDAGWASAYDLDDAASELARREDAPSTSVRLPADFVATLLESRGWTLETIPTGGTAYVKPGGKPRAAGGNFGADYLWERDEALTLALAAEALTVRS